MLTAVHLQSFRCFEKLSVPLKPLTVLVGPNDSGKSSLLFAIRCLAGVVSPSLLDVRRLERGVSLAIRGEAMGAPMITCVTRPDGTPSVTNWESIRPLGYYQLPSSGVPTSSPGASGVPELGETGNGLAALLDYLLRHDRPRFFAIEAALRQLIAGVEQLNIQTPDASTRSIELKFDGGVSLPASSFSTGVRLMLFFVTLAHHPSPPKLILLEEPENGVHPRRLSEIVTLLRALTQGKYGGNASQVILTTHSPYLLDQIDPTTDQVLVFKREPDGRRTAQAVEADKLRAFLGEFMLGEVWFNEGEEGLVRPRP